MSTECTLREGLTVETLGWGIALMDMGIHESLIQASTFIEAIENRQGLKVSCLEEMARRMGYVDEEQLLKLAQPMVNN